MKTSLFLAFIIAVFAGIESRASTPLHVAAAENDTNALAQAITGCMDINRAENSQGCTALHWAARFNRKDAVKYLVERGANINARNIMGMTPLHYAALRGHADMVELLIEKKAQVNVFDCQGLTPLHLAAQSGHALIIEILADSNADIEAKTNNRGLTPLHWAAFWGRAAAVNALLKSGADVNAPDNDGNNPFSWAELHNNDEVAHLLARKGGKEQPRDAGYTGYLNGNMTGGRYLAVRP